MIDPSLSPFLFGCPTGLPFDFLLSSVREHVELMMLNQGIQITDKPDGEDVQRVLSGLREYNYSHVKSDIRDIGIFVRDEGGSLDLARTI